MPFAGWPRRLRARELHLELADPAHDTAAVHLELRLARSPRADPTSLLGESDTLSSKAREPVAAEGELNLRLTFRGVGVLGEDVEDHRSAVDGGPTEDLLKIALLGGSQFVVEDDRVGVDGLADPAQFLRLAPPDVGGRIGCRAPLQHAGRLVCAGGVYEERKLVQAGFDLF